MKTVDQLAREVVEAIFNQAEVDGALHKDSAIGAARKVLLTGAMVGVDIDRVSDLNVAALKDAAKAMRAAHDQEADHAICPPVFAPMVTHQDAVSLPPARYEVTGFSHGYTYAPGVTAYSSVPTRNTRLRCGTTGTRAG